MFRNFNSSAVLYAIFCLVILSSCDKNDNANNSSNVNSNNSTNSNVSFLQGSGVWDVEGNFYPTIILNGREWMQKNLTCSRYNNGDAIPTNINGTDWETTTTGSYGIYQGFFESIEDSYRNDSIYGKLYNWYVVSDARGVCPTGWHVPSDSEWLSLIGYLDPNFNEGEIINVAGDLMKTAGDTINGNGLWYMLNSSATNQSGFSGLPAGWRIPWGGDYNHLGNATVWWSQTDLIDTAAAWSIELGSSSSSAFRGIVSKNFGVSIRCIKNL
jgi:uncharacterized protein (TIGR02145 family)